MGGFLGKLNPGWQAGCWWHYFWLGHPPWEDRRIQLRWNRGPCRFQVRPDVTDGIHCGHSNRVPQACACEKNASPNPLCLTSGHLHLHPPTLLVRHAGLGCTRPWKPRPLGGRSPRPVSPRALGTRSAPILRSTENRRGRFGPGRFSTPLEVLGRPWRGGAFPGSQHPAVFALVPMGSCIQPLEDGKRGREDEDCSGPTGVIPTVLLLFFVFLQSGSYESHVYGCHMGVSFCKNKGPPGPHMGCCFRRHPKARRLRGCLRGLPDRRCSSGGSEGSSSHRCSVATGFIAGAERPLGPLWGRRVTRQTGFRKQF